jgi:hypothetical protein
VSDCVWAQVAFGVAACDLDLGVKWFENPDVYGMWANRKSMFLGGEEAERTEGPERFKTPARITVILDSEVGSLSAKVIAKKNNPALTIRIRLHLLNPDQWRKFRNCLHIKQVDGHPHECHG